MDAAARAAEEEAKRRAAMEAAAAQEAAQGRKAKVAIDIHTSQGLTSHEKSKLYMENLEKKLNEDIGFYYWKKYVAAAIWANVSMPINLIITFLTALTAAQANTESLISADLFSKISIASLVITTLNTFFRPHAQMMAATESMQKWSAIGIEFETIYYSDIDSDYSLAQNIQKAVNEYLEIQRKVNEQRKAEGVGAINFLTDMIHLLIFATCAKRYKKWLPQERLIS
jgi:hypothetical protein